MRPLKINVDSLLDAFERDPYDETSAYLDTESGEIRWVAGDTIRAIEDGQVDALPEWQRQQAETVEMLDDDHGTRFLSLPRRETQDRWSDRHDFASHVPSASLKNALLDALNRHGAFSRFMRVLREHPRELKRWKDYERDCDLAAIVAWLNDHDIEPEWVES